MRDFQQSKVYGAENSLHWFYDNSEVGSINLMGVPLQLEPEARFGSLESVQAYVDRVLCHPAVLSHFGTTPPVKIRERKGQRSAHYHANVIAVNTSGTGWALRETVVLHELAHHLTPHDHHGHGPAFADTLITLLGLVMGDQVALALKILYDTAGVK